MEINIKDVVEHYLACLLWTEEDTLRKEAESIGIEDFVPTVHDGFTSGSRAEAEADVEKFCRENAEDILAFMEEERTWEGQIGHSFWLTRNRHGAGFMDFNSEAAEKLGKAAQEFPRKYAWVTEEGKVGVEGS